MSNNITLSEDEMVQIKSIQQEAATITIQAGKNALSIYETGKALESLTEHKRKLEEQYTNIIIKETKISNDLELKYGSGFVDIQSGVFIKDEIQPENETKKESNLQERTYSQ